MGAHVGRSPWGRPTLRNHSGARSGARSKARSRDRAHSPSAHGGSAGGSAGSHCHAPGGAWPCAPTVGAHHGRSHLGSPTTRARSGGSRWGLAVRARRGTLGAALRFNVAVRAPTATSLWRLADSGCLQWALNKEQSYTLLIGVEIVLAPTRLYACSSTTKTTCFSLLSAAVRRLIGHQASRSGQQLGPAGTTSPRV